MRRLDDDPGAERLTFTFDGRAVEAVVGDSVAAALLANGVWQFRRTPVSDAARAPFCMMGACYECLVEIDGVPNVQACMVRARVAMVVMPMLGARATEVGEGAGVSTAEHAGDSADG